MDLAIEEWKDKSLWATKEMTVVADGETNSI